MLVVLWNEIFNISILALAAILDFSPQGQSYLAGVIRYGLIRFLVSKNPMIENRIFSSSPIGKNLGGAPTSYGRHLGF